MQNTASWDLSVVMIEEAQALALDHDVELMLQFQAGNLGSFETLFHRHSRSVVNFAYRFVHNRAVAEELAQEIFLRVHDAAATYRAEAKFTTWLYRIATNVCLNEVRRPHFRAVHKSLDEPASEETRGGPIDLADDRRPDPHAILKNQAVARALSRALGQLPEKQRLAFILNKYQDLTYAEVAEVMHTSEKAVKSLIHRAKEAMAAQLKPLLPELL